MCLEKGWVDRWIDAKAKHFLISSPPRKKGLMFDMSIGFAAILGFVVVALITRRLHVYVHVGGQVG